MKKLVKKKTRLDSIQAYATCYCPASSCGTGCNNCGCVPPDLYQDSFAQSYSRAEAEQVNYTIRDYYS